ncbi:MAG TPA: hypothetical protein VIC58_02240 [Actinomycetota bacterium]|jgi:hypothetical protein
MDDFNALASQLAAGIVDLRACLILSRDGLVVGAYPQAAEVQAKPAWLQFAAVGDPERGFAQFGSETWCYVRRGPYAAFAVCGPGTRPGLLIDHMDRVLLAAEESRARREGAREPVPPAQAPLSKPRTPLHPEPRPVGDPVLLPDDMTPAVAASTPAPAELTIGPEPTPRMEPAGSEPAVATTPAPVQDRPAPPPRAEIAELTRLAELAERSQSVGDDPIEGEDAPALDEPEVPQPVESRDEVAPPAAAVPTPELEDEDDVDRFSLVREFGQLLQDGETVADG